MEGPRGKWGEASTRSTASSWATPFIGRRAELESITRMLSGHLAVSIVGIAGIAKSRLATEAARGWSTSGFGRAVVVDISGCSKVEDLERRVAFGAGSPADGALDNLALAMSRGEMLVVLDGCDGLESEAVRRLTELLERAESRGLLVTSQARLGLPREAVRRLGPLSLTDEPRPAPERLLAHDAPKLLLAAAGVAGGRTYSVPDEATAAEIAALCRHVNGIPLALEAAATCLRGLEQGTSFELWRCVSLRWLKHAVAGGLGCTSKLP